MRTGPACARGGYYGILSTGDYPVHSVDCFFFFDTHALDSDLSSGRWQTDQAVT